MSKSKNKQFWTKSNDIDLSGAIEPLYDKSPIYESSINRLYCLRVPLGRRANAICHNRDHQCARQGVFAANLARLGIKDNKHFMSLKHHVLKDELRRGYLFASAEMPHMYSEQPVSGDMLVGFCFGYIHGPHVMHTAMLNMTERLRHFKGLLTCGQMSPVANFNPGVNNSECPIPVGAQELTYLAGIKCGLHAAKALHQDEHVMRFKREYLIRFWLYGSWILCLMPTAGIWFKRGYNNDNVSIQAAYVLYKLADNWFERLVYKISLLNIWSLSWPWLNGFFSALVKGAWGVFPFKSYMIKCKQYAWSLKQIDYSISINRRMKANVWPVDPDKTNMGEFFCDEDQYEIRYGTPDYYSTLGQLTNLIWLSDEKQ